MKYFWLCSIFGFWMSLIFEDVMVLIFFVLVYMSFLWFRFNRFLLCVVWGISILCFSYLNQSIPVEPIPGEYVIYDIKAKYCLARKDDISIILYGVQDAHYYDAYQIDDFVWIEGIENIDQFSFKSYINKQSIYYSSDVKNQSPHSRNSSLRNNIYQWIRSLDNKDYYLNNYYGILGDETQDIIVSLGLPFLGFTYLLRKILLRFISYRASEVIVFLVGILYGTLFTFTPSLIRIVLFDLGKIFFDKWEHSFCVSTGLFLCLNPNYAFDFVFLFPVCIRIIYRFCHDMFTRILLMKMVLMIFQFFYFHEVDLTMFFLFGFLRKMHACMFLLSLVGLVFPSWFKGVYTFYESLISVLPNLSIVYVPGFVFIIVSIFLIYRIIQQKSWLFCLILWASMILLGNHLNPFFNVYVIDIGQGDCTLITEPFLKSAVMIDCGQNMMRDNVEDIIYPVLRSYNINKLDTLIITHDDYDHSGGMERLLDFIEIDQIVTEKDEEIRVDYPFYSLLEDRAADNENDNSIISYFSYDDINYLWTGDAGIKIEEQLLQEYSLNVDVLKLGHHGSSTSSSFDFLDSLRPKLSLVSAGRNNRYGHPSNRVVNDCFELGIDMLATNNVGMIHIFSFRGLSFFRTANGLFGILIP